MNMLCMHARLYAQYTTTAFAGAEFFLNATLNIFKLGEFNYDLKERMNHL